MTEISSTEWLVGSAITLFISIIAAGLWDILLKPMVTRLGTVLYTVMSLGAQRSKDRIYKEAAKGFCDGPGLQTLFFTIVILLSLGGYQAGQLIAIIDIRQNIPQYEVDCSDVVYEGSDAKKCEYRSKNKPPLFTIYILLGVIIGFYAVLMYRYLQVAQINRVVTAYNQNLKAVRPYIDDFKYFSFERAFAMIMTQREYVEISKALEEIAKKNGFELPG